MPRRIARGPFKHAEMAANALEEKINKIRQQNEEIRRRHEEVEEDKKNAAKLNALVQMVPSTDWPERKEPPEFSNPPRTGNKTKPAKEHHEHSQQYQPASGEGRKGHAFAQGQGPPPDPKYNFLADAEREEGERESTKDNSSRGQKYSRGMFRRKPGAKDGMQRDYRMSRGSHRDEHQPEYEAWRAERNRIDEDRISRQRTAEGNWRREWDNDKDGHVKNLSGSEKRTVVATDKNIKVTLNQGKGPVMSVKVNSPSIAGTGRVGPRQRSRVTYSSHSDVEVTSPDTESFSRPKSFEDRKGVYHENLHKSSNSRKSQLPPKKKDFSNKSPYFRKKEIKREDENVQQYHETESPQTENMESQKSHQSKPEEAEENIVEPLQDDKILMIENEKQSNIISSGESNMNNIEIKIEDNQNGNLNLHINEKNEVHADREDEPILPDLDLPVSEIDTEIEMCRNNGDSQDKLDELPNVEAIVTSECETTETNLTTAVKDDENETKRVEHSCDANKDTKETVIKTEDHKSEETKEILSDNCDNKQTKDMSEQENDVKHETESSPEEKEVDSVVIPSPIDVYYIAEENDNLRSENEALKEKRDLTTEDKTAITDEKVNTGNKQDVTKCIDETQERTDNNDRENSVSDSIVVDKIESLKEDLHVEEEKAASSDQN
ncbi:PREDICTED: coiled-coil domain-containing protein 9-like isoform X3 [Vollenhovia emeryi]|uniref:coiled-coil domain-containing protein 9-like isoform X3 n=1 Tax=Vollenhovia emeryi TaxID=411798 RepID=UPI0005F54D61|nr:PREDICTED: coiled-coil domain-containing protein 9-like isoform X3 [Vollenhovia emeryi]